MRNIYIILSLLLLCAMAAFGQAALVGHRSCSINTSHAGDRATENGESMAEGSIPNFQAAHDLAEKLYNLQKDQADRMLNMLTQQGTTLSALVTDMAVVKEQTKEVPTLKERIATLEQFKWKIVGWVAGAFIVSRRGHESAVAARSLRAIGECGNGVDSAARLAKGIVYHPHAAGIEQAGRAGRRVRGSRAAIVKWILG